MGNICSCACAEEISNGELLIVPPEADSQSHRTTSNKQFARGLSPRTDRKRSHSRTKFSQKQEVEKSSGNELHKRADLRRAKDNYTQVPKIPLPEQQLSLGPIAVVTDSPIESDKLEDRKIETGSFNATLIASMESHVPIKLERLDHDEVSVLLMMIPQPSETLENYQRNLAAEFFDRLCLGRKTLSIDDVPALADYLLRATGECVIQPFEFLA